MNEATLKDQILKLLDVNPSAGSPVLSVEEAAKELGIGRNTAYRLVQTGELPSVRMGRRILVPKAALRRILDGAAGSPKAA